MLECLNNNKLINPKLICAFCWFFLFFNKPKVLLNEVVVASFWVTSHYLFRVTEENYRLLQLNVTIFRYRVGQK